MRFCPICNKSNTFVVIHIKSVPIHVNLLWSSRASALTAPYGEIQLVFCPDCGHTYNSLFEPKKMKYFGSYENSLHFSPVFQQYAYELAVRLVNQYDLHETRLIEIGSGQGDFLKMLCRVGQNQGFGFDPSYLPSEDDYNDCHVTFIRDYYSEKYVDKNADFLCSRHVLEHIYSPSTFIADLRRSIGNPNMIVFFEVPNAMYTFQDLGIWDIIYEHYSFFSRYSLSKAFIKNGFEVLNLQETFGSQYLTIELRPLSGNWDKDQIDRKIPESLILAVTSFAEHFVRKVAQWQQRLADFQSQKLRIALWGAGSKGVSFLNFLRDDKVIQTVIDVNPRKQGQFVTGTGQHIQPPEFLIEYSPDIVIVMNPIYEREIKEFLSAQKIRTEILVA